MAEKGAALVAGVGARDGLGAHLARHAAARGHRVVLAGRTPERLEAVAADIAAAGGAALACPTDLGIEDHVIALCERAEREAGPLDLVCFNAGGFLHRAVLETTAAEVEALWRSNALGGFLVGREAGRRMVARGRGSILFTGATAALRGGANFAAFAAGKFALRALAQSMAREWTPRGVHVAHVVIDGVIASTRTRRMAPDLAEQADAMLDPQAIAEAFYRLHEQPRSAWTFEADLRPWLERF